MSSASRHTLVQMPADPSLQPAHVMAIRPDIHGARVHRGDYVMTIETAKGARNVVASADGTIELHIALMQDVEAGAAMFSIAPYEERQPYAGEDHAAAQDAGADYHPEPPEPASPAGAGIEEPQRSGFRTLHALFILVCLGAAAAWPGFVFANIGSPVELDQSFAIVAGALALALLISVWVLAKIPILAKRGRSGLVALVTLFAFAGALAAGVWSPEVRTLQETVAAPVVSFAKQQLGPKFEEYLALIKPSKPDAGTAATPAEETPAQDTAAAPSGTDTWLECMVGRSPEIRISGCTARIDSGETAPENYLARGHAYRQADRFEESLSDFNAAIAARAGVSDASALRERGLTLHAMGRYDAAIADFSKALLIKPSVMYVWDRAQSLERLGRTQEAIADYRKVAAVSATGSEQHRKASDRLSSLETTMPSGPTPKQVVESLYNGKQALLADRPFLSKQLAAALAAEEKGDNPRLDFDPIVDGQDADITGLTLTSHETSVQGNKLIVVNADFKNFDTATKVTYAFILEDGDWKLANIVTKDWNLLVLLK